MYANHQNVNREMYKHNPKANPIENAVNFMKLQCIIPKCMESGLTGIMKVIRIQKGERLLIPDMHVNKMYYLNSGLLKLSSEILHELKTLDFWNGGEYVLMASEFMEGEINKKFHIEAMEDCELVVIHKEALRPVLNEFLEMHIVLEKIAHLKSRRRVNHLEILMLDPKDRIAAMDHEDCLYKPMRLKLRLSHGELAKLLGISTTTLSKYKYLA